MEQHGPQRPGNGWHMGMQCQCRTTTRLITSLARATAAAHVPRLTQVACLVA